MNLFSLPVWSELGPVEKTSEEGIEIWIILPCHFAQDQVLALAMSHSYRNLELSPLEMMLSMGFRIEYTPSLRWVHLHTIHGCLQMPVIYYFAYLICTNLSVFQPNESSMHVRPSCSMTSLVPRLSPRMTTMNSKEGESLVPFRTWCNGTNVMDISIGKFRRHSRADRPFSYSVYLRVWCLGPLKQNGRPGYAVDDARQFVGTTFCHRRVRNN